MDRDRPFHCTTCEIELVGRPTFHVGLPFCCAGCVAGGPCVCSYDDPPADDDVRHCLDIAAYVGERPAAAPREAVLAGR